MRNETIDSFAQSAVAIELLGRPRGLAISTLKRTIKDVDEARLVAAAESLADVGVIRHNDGRLYATPALNRLDKIGLVQI